MMSGEIRAGHWILRLALLWLIQAGALIILSLILPGVHLHALRDALVAAAVIGLLNAILWPIISYVALPLMVATLGLLALVLNGFVIWAAAEILPGFSVDGFWAYVGLVVGMTALTTLFSSLLTIDDENSYYRNVVLREARRKSRRSGSVERHGGNGVIFLEIDGLAGPIFERAIQGGHMPTLAKWMESGSHQLLIWEPDLSSQTAASQAGILLGSNHEIPAFRWYERETKTVMVSSKPQNARDIEARLSTGNGLLVDGGVSRNNMFSGDAARTMLTVSAVLDKNRRDPGAYYAYFAYPYNMSRLLVLYLADAGREVVEAWRQKRKDIRPRLDKRGRYYPFLRAATTVAMRELTIYALLGDMFAGVDSAYATFVGYDEVAHHSGIERPESLNMLTKLDHQFGRLERAAKLAPRPYEFVVLSDHGQSQGATFKQRFGTSLSEVVDALVEDHHVINTESEADEGWGHVNAALTEGAQDDTHRGSGLVKHAVGSFREGDTVDISPDEPKPRKMAGQADATKEMIVMGSGNLGLVYFSDAENRLSVEAINERAPELIAGLTNHEGVSFILVRSEKDGALAIGRDGTHYLESGRLDGHDPLAKFGPNSVKHLLRTDGFRNVADIMLISMYEPSSGEVAAFEELVGSHGGLGGTQTQPFVFFPTKWVSPEQPIVGAASLHDTLKGWVNASREVAA